MTDLIDRETAIAKIEPDEYYHSNEVKAMLQDIPAVDVAPVVRCKDCVWYTDAYGIGEMVCMRPVHGADYQETGYMFPLEVQMPEDDFCSYGERKEGAD